MVKTVVDGSIAEHQASGPVYLPGGVFPNYRPLVIANQPNVSNALPARPTAPATVTAQSTSSALRQMVNPRLLTREQSQHDGQNVNRLTQEQVAAMFLPNPTIADPAQSLPIQQAQPRQHTVQPTQQQNLQHLSARLRTPDNRPGQQTVNQVIPEQVVHHVQADQSVMPQIIPEHLVHNIQPNLQNYQVGNLNYQYQPPSPHV
jgi:hypothetical protein